jgi:hypothetical protein
MASWLIVISLVDALVETTLPRSLYVLIEEEAAESASFLG